MSSSNAQPTIFEPPRPSLEPHESRFTEVNSSSEGDNDFADHAQNARQPPAAPQPDSQRSSLYEQPWMPGMYGVVVGSPVYPFSLSSEKSPSHPVSPPSPTRQAPLATEQHTLPTATLTAPSSFPLATENDPLSIEPTKEITVQSSSPVQENDRCGMATLLPQLPEMPFAPLAESSRVDPQIEFANYRELFMGDRQCRDCGAKIPHKRRQELLVTSNIMGNLAMRQRLEVTCPKCSATFCRGCATKLRVAHPLSEHEPCGEAAALALFEVLSSLDRAYLAHVQRISFFKGIKGKATRLGSRIGLSRLIRRSKSFSISDHALPAPQSPRRNSILSLLNFNADTATRAPPGGVPMSMEKRWHACLVAHIHAISELLALEHVFSHPSTNHLLSLSLLPEVLLGLLRNDCVTDLNEWSGVLVEMLQLIKTLADHASTRDLIMDQRFIKKRTIGLRDYVWKGTGIDWELEGTRQPAKLVKRCIAARQSQPGPPKFSTSRPLFHYLFKMSRQCEIFIHGVEPYTDPSKPRTSWHADPEDDVKQDTDLQNILGLCYQVVETKKHVLTVTTVSEEIDIQPSSAIQPAVVTVPEPVESVQPDPASTDEKEEQQQPKSPVVQPSAKEIDRKYSQMCELKSFEYVSLETEAPFFGQGNKHSHYFSSSIAESTNSRRNPKDRLQMLKQLSVLSTSLPDGIWVRVDDVRSDVLKAMIAGPVGTPYEGGLFEFDVFIPLDFPRVPPLVQLRTTGNGSVRFNPNLYHDGKVCLSLLGTWQGSADENWQPSTSTILQVLISIQSLIMVEHPYFNEPGRGAVNPKDRLSIEYNENIRSENVKWAMVDWMEKVRDSDGRVAVWSDVIAAHFTIYRNRIRVRVQEWSPTMLDRFDEVCDAMEKFRVRTTE